MRGLRFGIGVAILVAVVWAGGLYAADETARPATKPAADARFTGTLKCGASVELIGLVEGDVVRERWLADGTRDERALFEFSRFERAKVIASPPPDRGRRVIGVVVRFGLKLRDGSLASSESERWFGTALDAKDEPVKDIVVFHGKGDAKKKANDLRFCLATGKWAETDVRVTDDELGATKDGIAFTKAQTLRGGTYVGLIATETRWGQIGEGLKRLCARHVDGKVREAIPFQPKGKGPPAPYEHGFLFEGVEPVDLKEFWLERRPAEEWIEFRNVSYEPGTKTEVKIVTSDDAPPEKEREKTTEKAAEPTGL